MSYAGSNPVQIGIDSLRFPSAVSCSGTRVGEEKREGEEADTRDPSGGEGGGGTQTTVREEAGGKLGCLPGRAQGGRGSGPRAREGEKQAGGGSGWVYLFFFFPFLFYFSYFFFVF